MASFISAAELPSTNGRLFYCHQCSHRWRKTENSEYLCPQCREGFIEEVNDSANQQGESTTDPIYSIIHRIMSDISPSRRSRAHVASSRAGRARSRSRSPRMFYIGGTSEADRTGQNSTSSSRRLDRSISHAFHFDLDDLMSTFLSTRSAPVSQRVLLELPSLTIAQEQTESSCSICFDDFKLAETNVRKLPCHHLFHERCIFPWLRINGTCPVCRARLGPSDAGNEEVSTSQNDSNYDHIVRFMRLRRNTPRNRVNEASTSSSSVQTEATNAPRLAPQPLTVRLRRLSSLAQDRARAVLPPNINTERISSQRAHNPPAPRMHCPRMRNSNRPNSRVNSLLDTILLSERERQLDETILTERERELDDHIEARVRARASLLSHRSQRAPPRIVTRSNSANEQLLSSQMPLIDLTSSDSETGELSSISALNESSNSSSNTDTLPSATSQSATSSSSSSSSQMSSGDSDWSSNSDAIDLNRTRRIDDSLVFSDSEVFLTSGTPRISDEE